MNSTKIYNKNYIAFNSNITEQFQGNDYPKIALLISSEYEGFSRNGGIGSYYTSLSQNLAFTDWIVILIICQSDQKYAGKSTVGALKHVFSTGEIEEVLNLNQEHQLILNTAKQNSFVNYPDVNYQSIASWFYTQAFSNTFPDSQIYVEFPDINGFGYDTIQAKKSNLLGENCLTAITLHGCFEWVLEASDTINTERWLDRFCHREQISFENVDLAFFPSYFLKNKIESFGWETKHSHHLPYFIPIQSLVKGDKSSKKLPNNQGREYIPVVFFGRLEKRKGLETFLQSLHRLPTELQAQIKLIFLGKVVPFYSNNLKKINGEEYIKQELKNKFNYEIITNFFSQQAIQYIHDLDNPIVCLASPQENFPNTALEMGQLPISLVVSDTGGFRETLDLVKRTEGLYWFKPKDADSLREKLEEALKDYPQTPKVTEKSVLEKINKKLLEDKITYIEQAFAEIKPREKAKNKVTIAIISFNQGEYLLDCLNSIKNQTYEYLEVIVIDDNSSDSKSRNLFVQVQSLFPNFKFISIEKRKGIGAIKNHLLEISSGDYFLSFNPQVRLIPMAIEKFIEITINSNASIVTSAQKEIGKSDLIVSYSGGGLPTMMKENVYGGECCFFSRELLEKFPYTEDKDIDSQNREIIAASLVTRQTIICYPYPLYEYIISSDSNNIKEISARAKYSLRQYLAKIPLAEWSKRQIYMLLTRVQQLEDLPAQISYFQLQADKNGKKLHETATQLHLTNEKLHQAKVEIEEYKAHTYQIENQYGEKLHKTATQLHLANEKLHNANVKIEEHEAYIHQIENQLQSAKDRITAMESSKFWNLRQKWFKLKRYLGLSTDE